MINNFTGEAISNCLAATMDDIPGMLKAINVAGHVISKMALEIDRLTLINNTNQKMLETCNAEITKCKLQLTKNDTL